MRVRISEIRVKNRVRKHTGDISSLRESMKKVGLLQPVLIDVNNHLLAGYRRLQAARELGWDTIEVKLVEVRNKKERLAIEVDENITRKDFTPFEIERVHALRKRYGRKGIFGRIIAWLLDFVDSILRRSR